MRIAGIALAALSICGCAGMEAISPEEPVVEVVVEVPGLAKDKIHDATKIWIAQNFGSARAVVDVDDKAAGIIIGNARIKYPCSGMGCLGKGDWQLAFKMRVDSRDARFRVQFFSLTLILPPPYGDRPLVRGEIDDSRPTLAAFGERIRSSVVRQRSDSF